ncbi:MAG: hypothetical protein JNJ58_00405 [Chitinophagaceae bacterium]|nr:hypothetical protein [Chitinophagaceae bacterium]
MKQYLLLICMFYGLWAQGQNRKGVRMVTVKGKVTQTADYCGGARPTDEMLEKLNAPHPLASKTIYIKIGAMNADKSKVYKKVVTDEEGRFTVKLPAGRVYSFVEEWKSGPYKKPQPQQFVEWDLACWRKKYLEPDFVLNLKTRKFPDVEINYHQRCFYSPYCGQYSGPLPP